MVRGRKPKPTRLKLAEGNPGKRKSRAREPQPAAGEPACPAELDAAAREEWQRLCKALIALGILTEIDRAVLAAYCQCWSRWLAAERDIARRGVIVVTVMGAEMQNPSLPIANKALQLMLRFGAELGLTPSARTRIDATPAQQPTGLAAFTAERPS
ncbi:MAG TPA: phage terminase small subunit P27 family [Pirellulales bacterium]|jgi:P27 family predicted phage terminase small subunit